MTTAPHYELLPIDSLDLDTGNPRIRKWIEQYGESPNFEQMLLALGAGSSDPESGSTVTFQSLKESIRAQKGIINPIIVEPTSNGRYRVIEGNTRVAIYRVFRDNGEDGEWERIPALVHKDLPSSQVDAIRLQCHIVGPRPWDPYSKAKYLDYLLNEEHLPLSTIVDLCGGRKREITEYVDAYKDMEKYYRPVLESDSDFDASRFSAFVELQKANVKASILEAQFNYGDFAQWVRDEKIDPLATVRALPRILKNPAAKAKFLTVGAREALKVLDVPPSPALTNVPLDQLLMALSQRLDAMPYPDVKAMKKEPGSQRVQLLMQVRTSINELCDDIASE